MCMGTTHTERSRVSGKGKAEISVNVAKNSPRPSSALVLNEVSHMEVTGFMFLVFFSPSLSTTASRSPLPSSRLHNYHHHHNIHDDQLRIFSRLSPLLHSFSSFTTTVIILLIFISFSVFISSVPPSSTWLLLSLSISLIILFIYHFSLVTSIDFSPFHRVQTGPGDHLAQWV